MTWLRNWFTLALCASTILLGGCSGVPNFAATDLFTVHASPPSPLFSAKMRVARKAMALGSFATAEKIYESVLDAHPDRTGPLLGLGKSLMAQHAFGAAVDAFRAVLARQSDHPQAMEGLNAALAAKDAVEPGNIHRRVAFGSPAKRDAVSQPAEPSPIGPKNKAVEQEFEGARPDGDRRFAGAGFIMKPERNRASIAGPPTSLGIRNVVNSTPAITAGAIGNGITAHGGATAEAATPRAATVATRDGAPNSDWSAIVASDGSQRFRVGAHSAGDGTIFRSPPGPMSKTEQLRGVEPREFLWTKAIRNAAPASNPAEAGGIAEFTVQIAAFRSQAAARRGLRLLAKKVDDVLPELHVVVRAPGQDSSTRIAYRVRSSGFSTRARARDMCARVKTRRLTCLVVRYRQGAFIPQADLTSSARDSRRGNQFASRREPGIYSVQLAAYRSPSAAERGRRILSRRAPNLLHGLETLVRPIGQVEGNNIRYRLRTPVLEDRNIADNLCASLRARAIFCIVVKSRNTYRRA